MEGPRGNCGVNANVNRFLFKGDKNVPKLDCVAMVT